jgi:hypothetical protein
MISRLVYNAFISPIDFEKDKTEGRPAWLVANRLSSIARMGSGDITLNKTGSPVTFGIMINLLLNR